MVIAKNSYENKQVSEMRALGYPQSLINTVILLERYRPDYIKEIKELLAHKLPKREMIKALQPMLHTL